MATFISAVKGKEIRDSREKPTLEITVLCGEIHGSFQVPSGASTGAREAVELRDVDGGMDFALKMLNDIIAPALIGKDVTNQREIDNMLILLDNTTNKSHLGGNTMVGVSIACAKAAAKAQKQELYEYLRTLAEITPSRKSPYLYVNLINGGKHAKSPLAFQEYHVIPKVDSIRGGLNIIEKVIAGLEAAIKERGYPIIHGDEGGYVLPLGDVVMPLEILKEVCQKAGVSQDVYFALDVAASSFFKKNMYCVNERNIGSAELSATYDLLLEKFPMFSIEDPYNEDAFGEFATLQKDHPTLVVVGDDLTVTSARQVEKAVLARSISGVIIKPNQIGTLSETLDAMKKARDNNIHCIVSHRSGETTDDFIADLATAFGVFGIKAGSPHPPERAVKYARLQSILE